MILKGNNYTFTMYLFFDRHFRDVFDDGLKRINVFLVVFDFFVATRFELILVRVIIINDISNKKMFYQKTIYKFTNF